YRQILSSEPNHARALFLLGTLKLQTQQSSEAVELLTAAARQSPDDFLVYSNLGAACQMAGDLDAAIAAQQRAVAIAPQDAPSQMNLALALRGRGRFDEALAAARIAANLAPDSTEALNTLGDVLLGA